MITIDNLSKRLYEKAVLNSLNQSIAIRKLFEGERRFIRSGMTRLDKLIYRRKIPNKYTVAYTNDTRTLLKNGVALKTEPCESRQIIFPRVNPQI